MLKKIIWIGLFLIILMTTSCEVKNGTVATEVDIPLDDELVLYGENAGIHPETSILDDPENPYADANLNMDNVWDLHDECPSPKGKFYLWASILAKMPVGEYQYFTALSLHELYTVSGSDLAKEQTKKAYKAVLDHFFNSTTWYEAWWLGDETYYAVTLRDMACQNMYDPSELNLLALYDDPAYALADLSEWGYVYDFETGSITRVE